MGVGCGDSVAEEVGGHFCGMVDLLARLRLQWRVESLRDGKPTVSFGPIDSSTVHCKAETTRDATLV